MMGTKDTHNPELVIAEMEASPIHAQAIQAASSESLASLNAEDFGPLFDSRVAEQLRTHWLDIQNSFVDDPKAALQAADVLVTHVTENIISTFSEKRLTLEGQWQSADQISTEELRLTLKRYRAFFNRLLALEY